MTINRAVMEQRHEAPDSLDFFPTYPFATRALCQQVLNVDGVKVWEPMCGQGHMSHVLKDYGAKVFSSDIHPYGYGAVGDFFAGPDELFPGVTPPFVPDWIISNPAFNRIEDFIAKALTIAEIGVAVYARLAILETIGRFERFYSKGLLHAQWVFVERVPVSKGWCDPDGGSATAVGWYIFKNHPAPNGCITRWIKPCREHLEYPQDYALPLSWMPT
jgi:hypothetical protein